MLSDRKLNDRMLSESRPTDGAPLATFGFEWNQVTFDVNKYFIEICSNIKIYAGILLKNHNFPNI